MTDTGEVTLSVTALRDLYTRAAIALGANEEEAAIYSACFLAADLRHNTQGLPLWLEWAFPLAEAGGGVFGVPLRIEQESPAGFVFDGSGGIGQVVATQAMEHVIARAGETGIAIGLVNGTTDIAMASNYAMQALEHGYIGIAASTAGPASVAPWGGQSAVFGTDPLAVAFPSEGDPIVIDMCCASYSIGTLVEAARSGHQDRFAVVAEADGKYGTRASAIVTDITVREPALSGAILPEGVKGSALLLIVELLAGVLTGNGVSADQVDFSFAAPPKVGVFLCAIDIAKFLPLDTFRAKAAALAQLVRAVTPASGFDALRVPGDRAAQLTRQRQHAGIAINARHWGMIGELCQRHGLDLPAS